MPSEEPAAAIAAWPAPCIIKDISDLHEDKAALLLPSIMGKG